MLSTVSDQEDTSPCHAFSDEESTDRKDELASLLGECGIEIKPLSEEEMRSYSADAFYKRLSRRELRDLLWATQSSDTCPFAVLVVLIETNPEFGDTHGQITQTFIARMDSDLAEFCESVAVAVNRQLPVRDDCKKVLAQKGSVEQKLPDDGRDSQGSTDDDEKPSLLTQVTEDRNVHLIYSDHPYCLWKPCVNVLEHLLRVEGERVTQHRFSGVWRKRVELIQI